ncbi:purine-cytosine permease family protein [Siminovitchia sediminis]|uniref:Purine-cytosine permease family protein n=1 Tax=Siminovitchia sediminis TaxID=1274353 RepID=A0ABW4KKL2_9BACI
MMNISEQKTSKLEIKGIDYIPENERNSTPLNVFFVIVGAQFSYPIMLLGTLPVIFGLGWWSSFFALTVGLLIGSIIIGPIAALGTKTGTNSIVSSGAHFGTRGRVISSVLTIFIGLGFYALAIWTGAQSLAFGSHRLFNWEVGTGTLVIGAVIITAITIAAAIYGQSIVLSIEKFGTWIVGTLLVLSVIVFLPQFDVSYQGGNYILGSFWPTWLLSVSVGLSLPISYTPFLNDYARYVPNKSDTRHIRLATSLGMFVGCWISLVIAAYLMTTLKTIDTPFVEGIIEQSPVWFTVPLILIGLFGSISQGSFALYGSGLGLESIGWGLKRIPTTIIVSIAAIVLIYLAVFVYNLIDAINGFVTIIIVAVSPWMAINLVGYYLFKGQYSPMELHQSSNGKYWYSNGFNLPAVSSWVIAVIVGLLFTNTTVFVGPFSDAFGGIDVSFVASAIVALVLFYVFSKKSNGNIEKVASDSNETA